MEAASLPTSSILYIFPFPSKRPGGPHQAPDSTDSVDSWLSGDKSGRKQSFSLCPTHRHRLSMPAAIETDEWRESGQFSSRHGVNIIKFIEDLGLINKLLTDEPNNTKHSL